MAVFSRLEAHVVVNGKHAKEYNDSDAEPEPNSTPSVSTYIEAVPGAFYGFRFWIRAGYDARKENIIAASVFVDGQLVAQPFIGVKKLHPANSHSRCVQTTRDCFSVTALCEGKQVEQKLQFKEIELCTTPLDPYLPRTNTLTGTSAAVSGINAAEKMDYGELGTFRIEFWRAIQQHRMTAVSFPKTNTGNAIPEKALKGKSLDVNTGFDHATILKNYMGLLTFTASFPILKFQSQISSMPNTSMQLQL
ncbi:hypothetical protein LTR84_001791 [Exophiala bonariae]|uniref:DUF7918 domain-containing protein n=1 Tax=Exophiala bonariae TaxID=1690606 RepID=A0AAV9NDU4_9EURO|nr:hypothetical protein LTR84_001791 [Exophiala bonariae]